jgi:serine protease Do
VTDEIAESLGLKPARGAIVAAFDVRGPAKLAGFALSDVIVAFDGTDIKDAQDLSRAVAQSQIDKIVSIVIWRKGKEETLTARLGQVRSNEDAATLPQQAARSETSSDLVDQLFREFFKQPGGEELLSAIASLRKAFGFGVAHLDEDLRSRYKVATDVNGLAVTAVDGGSPAAEKGLKPGDVIADVQHEKTSTVVGFQKRVERLKKEGRKVVVLLVAGADGNTRFVAMPLR